MGSTKRERLQLILQRLADGAPYRSDAAVLDRLAVIMREVEDEFSGVPESPDGGLSVSDGRMYPPHERFERKSSFKRVRVFRQRAHWTWVGLNGALRIARLDGTIEIDLPGSDEVSIDALFQEKSHECH